MAPLIDVTSIVKNVRTITDVYTGRKINSFRTTKLECSRIVGNYLWNDSV